MPKVPGNYRGSTGEVPGKYRGTTGERARGPPKTDFDKQKVRLERGSNAKIRHFYILAIFFDFFLPFLSKNRFFNDFFTIFQFNLVKATFTIDHTTQD